MAEGRGATHSGQRGVTERLHTSTNSCNTSRRHSHAQATTALDCRWRGMGRGARDKGAENKKHFGASRCDARAPITAHAIHPPRCVLLVPSASFCSAFVLVASYGSLGASGRRAGGWALLAVASRLSVRPQFPCPDSIASIAHSLQQP